MKISVKHQLIDLANITWPYPWDTAEVGDDFRLSLACEKWRAKAMVKRHSKRGKKFVLYYGISPVRHLRVRRVA